LNNINWNNLAAGALKAELKRRNINYTELVTLLSTIDVHETHASILNKLSRGSFQFSFFLQCATVIGITTLRLDDLVSIMPDSKKERG
jgi:hypothetical protein